MNGFVKKFAKKPGNILYTDLALQAMEPITSGEDQRQVLYDAGIVLLDKLLLSHVQGMDMEEYHANSAEEELAKVLAEESESGRSARDKAAGIRAHMQQAIDKHFSPAVERK